MDAEIIRELKDKADLLNVRARHARGEYEAAVVASAEREFRAAGGEFLVTKVRWKRDKAKVCFVSGFKFEYGRARPVWVGIKKDGTPSNAGVGVYVNEYFILPEDQQ